MDGPQRSDGYAVSPPSHEGARGRAGRAGRTDRTASVALLVGMSSRSLLSGHSKSGLVYSTHNGRQVPTLSGRSRPRSWTPPLGGMRAYRGRLGKDRRPRHNRRSIASALPFVEAEDLRRIEAASPEPRNAHPSGIPALRRPSYIRSCASTKRGSPPRDIWCAFHAAIVLSGPVEGSARYRCSASRACAS